MNVLVVEDHRLHARLLSIALAHRVPGLDIELIGDGLSASRRLADAAAGVPALLVFDLDLPGRNGHELLEECAASDRLAGVPAVIVTSSDRMDDAERSLELGARLHLRKPLDAEGFGALADQLARLLRSG